MAAARTGAGVAAMPAIRYLDSNVPAGFKYAGLAPVAQLDRALPSEGRGQGFESLRARQLSQWVIAPSVLEYGVAEYTPLFRPARSRRRTRVALERVLQTIRR